MAEQSAVLGLGGKIEAGTKQAFSAIADGFRQIAKAMSDSAGAMRKVGQEAPAKIFEDAAKSINKLTSGLDKQIGATKMLSQAQVQAAEARKKAESDAAQAQAKSTSKLAAANAELEKTSNISAKAAAQLDVLRAKFHDIINAPGSTGKSANNLLSAYIPKADDAGQLKVLEVQLQRLQNSFRSVSSEAIKSASSFQSLNKAFPGFESQIRALDKTTLSYNEQVNVLKRLKAARSEAEVAQLKESKALIAAANLNAKAAASVDALALRYNKLLAVGGSIGASARNIFKNYTPLASDSQKLVEMKVRLQELQTKLREVEATATKSASSFQSLNRSFPQFGKQIAAMSKTTLSYNEQVNVLKRLEAARKADSAAVDRSAADYKKQSEGIQRLRKQYADLRLSTDRYGQAANKIIANIRAHNIEIEKASAALARLKSQQKAAEGSFTTFSGAIHQVTNKLRSYAGYMIASSAVFAFISGVREAVTAIASYDQSLRDLQAITGPTQAELTQMAGTMKKVAGDTKFSAAETAEGMKLLGQAGLDASEVVAAIPAVTNLATGTMSDLASVIDLTSTTMRAFGLAAKDTGYITDVFANAVNKSKLTIEDIKTAFNYIAPAAHNAGMSLDETARIMMILRDNGLKASSMATGFRRILAKLAIPTESFKKNIAEAGMSMADFDVNALGISQVLHNLSKVVTTNKEAFEDFGIYGSAAVTALVKDVDKFDALAGIINKQGSAAEMAAIQMQGLENMFKNLQNKVQNLWIAIGEAGLIGVLKSLINIARVTVDVITDLANNGFVQFVAKVLLARGAVALLIAAFNWFSKISMVTTAVAAVAAGLGAVTTPAAAATTAMTALTGSVGALKAVLMSFLPTAIITALTLMTYKTLTYTQSLKDAKVELGALSDAANSNAASISGTVAMLKKGTMSQEEQKGVIDSLIDKYSNFGVELRNATGDSEKLIEVLNKIKEVEDNKAKNALSQSMKNSALQLEDNIKSQESWLTVLRNGIQAESVAKVSKQQFIDTNNSLVESMIQSAKRMGKTNVEIRAGFTELASSGMLGGQSDVIMKRMEEVLKSLEDPAKQAGLRSGAAVMQGLEEGMDTDAIAKKAEAFNESLATIDFKSANQTIEKEMAQRLYAISVSEALGTKSHEEAEMAKLNITIASYDKMVDAARAYHLAAKSGGTSDQQIEAQTRVDAAVEKSNQIRLQKLETLGQKRIAIEEKIKAQVEKQTEEQTKHDDKLVESKQNTADKISALEKATGLKAMGVAKEVLEYQKAKAEESVDLEETVTSKIVEIANSAADKRIEAAKDFEDKKKELVRARVDIERDAAADIGSIEDSLADKITNIQMRGLDGTEREVALEQAAYDRLAAGRRALAEASRTNDKDAIARAKELIDSAGGYYDQLADPDRAISGLRAVTAAAVEARKAQKAAELAENSKKIADELKAHKDKIAKIDLAEEEALTKTKDRFQLKIEAINLHYEKVMAKEAVRHQREMSNIQTEINKLNEKAGVIKNEQAAVVATPPPSGNNQSSHVGIASPDFDMQKYERDVGLATSEGIKKGVQNGIQASAEVVKQAVSNSVSDGAYEGLIKDVKVNGMPLAEWEALGKKQGEATVAAITEELADFDISETVTGDPVSVVINPATKKEIEPLLESIQETLAKYPGEPQLDFELAESMLRNFVKSARNKYKIEIPVTTTQNKADGGPVYAMAAGGKIPGTKSPKDKVTVKSRPGEWYIPDEPASFWSKNVGSWFMNAVHKPMSQAGKYLKDSVLKGPSSRAVPIPVPSKQNTDTEVLSSLKNFSTLDAKIGDRMDKFLTELGGGMQTQPAYNITLNYSGPSSQAAVRDMAKRLLGELDTVNRRRS